MKFHGITMTEGSDITNLTVDSGTNFPNNPTEGELFFRSDVDVSVRGLYCYIGGTWDRVSTTDATTVQNGVDLPSAANAGDIFYLNTNDSQEGLYVYNGSIWNLVSTVVGGVYLPLIGGTITGDLQIIKSSYTNLILNPSASGLGAGLNFRVNSALRWVVGMNDSSEYGSNNGSNFNINRYTDNGTFIDTPIVTFRATGQTWISSLVVDPLKTASILPSVDADTAAIFAKSQSSNNNVKIQLVSGTSGTASINFGDSDGASPGVISYDNADNSFSLSANSSIRLRITAAGSVDFNARTTTTQNAITATASTTINCSLGDVFVITMSANITTLAFSNVPTGSQVYTVTLFLNYTGNFTVTWPNSVKWTGDTAPTQTATNLKTDVIALVTYNGGTTWYGFVGGLNYTT